MFSHPILRFSNPPDFSANYVCLLHVGSWYRNDRGERNATARAGDWITKNSKVSTFCNSVKKKKMLWLSFSKIHLLHLWKCWWGVIPRYFEFCFARILTTMQESFFQQDCISVVLMGGKKCLTCFRTEADSCNGMFLGDAICVFISYV